MASTKRNAGYLGIFVAGAIAFGAKTLWHEVDTTATIDALKAKISVELFDRYVKGILPISYGGLCLEKYGDNPALVAAVKSYNERNSAKMKSLVNSVKAKGDMTDAEKDAFQSYVYAKVVSDIREKPTMCAFLASRINEGAWDL